MFLCTDPVMLHDEVLNIMVAGRDTAGHSNMHGYTTVLTSIFRADGRYAYHSSLLPIATPCCATASPERDPEASRPYRATYLRRYQGYEIPASCAEWYVHSSISWRDSPTFFNRRNYAVVPSSVSG